MSARSKKSSKKAELTAARAKARRLSEEYQVILSFEDGEWFGRGLELPHVFGDGATPEACIRNTRQGMAALVEHLLTKGERPPTPAREGIRSEQVNVRLSAHEKARLEQAAK